MRLNEENQFLQAIYNITAWFYDLLDFPWERQYRQWRPGLLKDIRGSVLEAGVGTGRNLEYYHPDVKLTGIELSSEMLMRAEKRGRGVHCAFTLKHEDATVMSSTSSESFDWVYSTFMCCVMPDHLQPLAIEQFGRVLKPGGRFRLLELIYSKDSAERKKQDFFAPFVEKVFGARFDRNTLSHLQKSSALKVENTYFLKKDIYLVIEGICMK